MAARTPARGALLYLTVLFAAAALLPRAGLSAAVSPLAEPEPPSHRLRPEALKAILNDRDIHAHASLDDLPGSRLKRYSVYAAELVHASLEKTRRTLTDYKLYPKMISYIDRADYSPVTRVLDMEGGIWKFRLHSLIRFEERSERWIHFTIVGGHFTGLSGDFLFEPMGERGTLVYLSGEQKAERWPPKFVIERGAEIVFEYTAKRMRSYIESMKDGGDANEQGVPKPRSHL